MDICTSVGKYLLCMFNFVFFIVSSLLLGVGFWLVFAQDSFMALFHKVDFEHVKEYKQPELIQQAAYLLIAAGGVLFILSFLGYCGAMRESPGLLTAYGIFLIIILVMQVTAGVFVMVTKDRIEDETRKFLTQTLDEYYTDDPEDPITKAWDQLMINMECCGVDSYMDFNDAQKFNPVNGIPRACCVDDRECTEQPDEDNSNFINGCLDAVKKKLVRNSYIILAMGLGLAVLQVLLICIAFCLSRGFRRYRK